jgi:hypothetical protein
MTAAEPHVALPTPTKAEVAVAITGLGSREAVAPLLQTVEQSLITHFPGRGGVVFLADHDGSGERLDAGETAATPGRVVSVVAPPAAERTGKPASRAQFLKQFFESATGLGVSVLATIDSELLTVEPAGLSRLLRPVLTGGADFVAPYYVRPRFAGTITSGIVYPMTRSLYGRRLRFPFGGEFACSAHFGKFCAAQGAWAETNRAVTDLWLAHRALTGGFKLSQAVIGGRSASAADDSAELSAVLAGVLGVLFGEMERNVPVWQKVRGSEPVALIGTPTGTDQPGPVIDFERTVGGFRLGLDNLMPVWEVVLPPTTLHGLRKLARQGAGDFRLPDPLWARIVYDFAIGFHTRVMSREHLLSAFTPLYLGWLASHVAEMGDADFARRERRVEELCLEFETEKPYLISRWRWPDRFNP